MEPMLPTAATGRRPRRRTQEERRAETRNKLIDATILLLQEKGAATMTTEEIATTAGVTRGALQYHFASPKELLKATVTEIADRLSIRMDVGELKKLDLPERIDRVVDFYWRGFGSPTYIAIIELAVGNRLDPELGSTIRETLAELERERSAIWSEIFFDSELNQEEVLSWRSSLLVMLRGLALTKMLSAPEKSVEPRIRQLKDMFNIYLDQARHRKSA